MPLISQQIFGESAGATHAVRCVEKGQDAVVGDGLANERLTPAFGEQRLIDS